MYPPYQIDPTLPFAPSVNASLVNIQRGATILGPARGLSDAYSAAIVAEPGDPLDGTLIPGTDIGVNEATTVQNMIAADYMLAPIADKPLQEILDANVGPITAPDYWNFSDAQFGLIAGTPLDPSLKQGTVLQVNGTEVTAVSGLLLPS